MMASLIIAAVLLGLFVLLRLVVRQNNAKSRSPLPKTPPVIQSGVKVVAQPPVQAPAPDFRTPPGTADLDDVDALRPEIDASALASTRLTVTQVVPDGVLADALLDATPAQLQHLFAAVPDNVLAEALGHQNTTQQPIKAADLAQLKGIGDAVDELDFWNLSDKS
ncbi:hypothetical protein [Deinococcus sp. QL22]|uniref:hypothetical protein n=1 Tax=Deinococcus sp. QL22 TaxID=2939437 RepID=UPI002016AAB8|nr:hypothetical protein [Deinococcus sp. QL22]UQN09741.1 hypothetical protein M1R55_25045 [Deinococcus sp. QL22]